MSKILLGITIGAGIGFVFCFVLALIQLLDNSSWSRSGYTRAEIAHFKKVRATLVAIPAVGCAIILFFTVPTLWAQAHADEQDKKENPTEVSSELASEETSEIAWSTEEESISEPETSEESATMDGEQITTNETETATDADDMTDTYNGQTNTPADANQQVQDAITGTLKGFNNRVAGHAETEEESEVASTAADSTAPNTVAAKNSADAARDAAEVVLANFAARFAPDTSKCEVPEIIRIDPDEASREFGQYRLDTKLHTDWKEADWLQEYMARINYGSKPGEEAIDLLMFPAWSDWLWLEQAMGTRKVTADDLKGVDLTNHDAVIKVLDAKIPQWKAAWDALSDTEKASRIDELVYTSICNCPAAAEAWYLAFCEAEGVYDSCKDILDDVGRRIDAAYNLTITVKIAGQELSPEDKDYPRGRERWLVYPDNVKFFNTDRPEYSATYSDDYFENIAAQLCHIYQSMKSGKIQKLSADKHWGLPRLTISAMRRVAEANYVDYYAAQVKLVPGKNNEIAYKYGVNTSDLRPEMFPVTASERQVPPPPPPKKTTDPNLWVQWKFMDINGEDVQPEVNVPYKAGKDFSFQSTVAEGCTAIIAVQEGISNVSLNESMVLSGKMPGNNVHIVVVYTPIPAKYNVLIDYKYEHENGEKVGSPYSRQHYAGEVVDAWSPDPGSNYTVELARWDGITKDQIPDWRHLVFFVPTNDVHIVLVYKKKGTTTTDNPPTNDPPTNDPPTNNPPTPPTIDPPDGVGSKKPQADAVHNSNADYTGGEQESGLNQEQDIAAENAAAENYTPPASSSSTSTSTTTTPTTTTTTPTTVHEGDTTPPARADEIKADTGKETQEIKDSNTGDVTIIEKEVDPSKEENRGKLTLDD